jgi:hypothetical protein
MNKLFTITRADITSRRGDPRIAQTAHAVAAFATTHPEPFQAWALPEQRNIICLEVTDGDALVVLLGLLYGAGLRVAEFRETDLGNELTAIAVEEAGAKWLSTLPLAGRPARAAA